MPLVKLSYQPQPLSSHIQYKRISHDVPFIYQYSNCQKLNEYQKFKNNLKSEMKHQRTDNKINLKVQFNKESDGFF